MAVMCLRNSLQPGGVLCVGLLLLEESDSALRGQGHIALCVRRAESPRGCHDGAYVSLEATWVALLCSLVFLHHLRP